LLHDNARPHITAHTIESLLQLNSEVLKHPLYGPDLAPSDYRLFGPLKDTLEGHHFTSDLEVKETVHKWLVTQPKTFFSYVIQKLLDCWTGCAERDGDFTKKYVAFERVHCNCIM
jgi:hypothetical protein